MATKREAIKPLQPKGEGRPQHEYEKAAYWVAEEIGKRMSRLVLPGDHEKLSVYTGGFEVRGSVRYPVGAAVTDRKGKRGRLLGCVDEGAVIECADGSLEICDLGELTPYFEGEEGFKFGDRASVHTSDAIDQLSSHVATLDWMPRTRAGESEAGREYREQLEAEIRRFCAGLWPRSLPKCHSGTSNMAATPAAEAGPMVRIRPGMTAIGTYQGHEECGEIIRVTCDGLIIKSDEAGSSIRGQEIEVKWADRIVLNFGPEDMVGGER